MSSNNKRKIKCKNCGIVKVSFGKFFCSRNCRTEYIKMNGLRLGKNNPNFGLRRAEGNRIKNSRGYKMVRCSNHPNAVGCYILEHRLTMEKQIGRYLEKNEIVHHKNGIRTDNRIENLELLTSNHPPGHYPITCPKCGYEIK